MSARARAALAASCFAINKNLIMLSLKKKENTFHSCKDFAVMSLQMIPQIRWVSPREDSESWVLRAMLADTFLHLFVGFRTCHLNSRKFIVNVGSVCSFLWSPWTAWDWGRGICIHFLITWISSRENQSCRVGGRSGTWRGWGWWSWQGRRRWWWGRPNAWWPGSSGPTRKVQLCPTISF